MILHLDRQGKNILLFVRGAHQNTSHISRVKLSSKFKKLCVPELLFSLKALKLPNFRRNVEFPQNVPPGENLR